MAAHQQPSRSDLLAAAWEVAVAYRAHDSYGSEQRACAALKRRQPGFTQVQYENAIRKAVALYDAAVVVVACNARDLWAQTDVAANQSPDYRALVPELHRHCPGFRVSHYVAALGWVFFWHHLK